MSSLTIQPHPGGFGRVRVRNFRKIEAPDLSSRAAVEKLFEDASRVTRAERAKRAR